MPERAIEFRRRHAAHVLFTFLAASAALHAAALALLPGLSSDRELPQVKVLEVVLVQSAPQPVAPTEPMQAPAPSQRVVKASVQPQLQRMTDTTPLLALPESHIRAEPAFTVPVPSPAEPRPAQKTEDAIVAVRPPSFSASYLSNPPPRYPLAARRAGEQGTVTLRVLIARDGLPTRVELEKSSGSSHLDAAAREAVRTWRFEPARRGAEPVESWHLVPIVFRLEGTS